jgi:hypothetical protein
MLLHFRLGQKLFLPYLYFFVNCSCIVPRIAANREAAWRQAGLHKFPDNATSEQKYTNLSNGGTPPLAPNRALCAVLPNISLFLFSHYFHIFLFASSDTLSGASG